jgi:hypothetical protein
MCAEPLAELVADLLSGHDPNMLKPGHYYGVQLAILKLGKMLREGDLTADDLIRIASRPVKLPVSGVDSYDQYCR